MLCILNVGTVPTLCILYVGTVPMLCILNVGTVPTFSHSLFLLLTFYGRLGIKNEPIRNKDSFSFLNRPSLLVCFCRGLP